jgi:hypothetical protein
VSPIVYMRLIWVAGAIQFAIVFANAWLPDKLRVRQGLSSAPLFLRQIFYVHWMYIVLVVGLFSTLCFLFPADLAGGSPLGRFLSFSLWIFWLLRVLLQWFYYDNAGRRELGALDGLYLGCLLVLVAVFGLAAVHPLRN